MATDPLTTMQQLIQQCPQVSAYYKKNWFPASIRKLPERWQWCTALSGEYVVYAEV